MIQKGDKVICYVDDIEKYKKFEVMAVDYNNRCHLKGIDTNCSLLRILSNDVNYKLANYTKLED